ncbi:M36 family metallopeptidase [Bacillus timonensis]|nr:M36 family metallopeptidase [Bacillus timonensis]
MGKKTKILSVISTVALTSQLLLPTSLANKVDGSISQTSVLDHHHVEENFDIRNVLNTVLPTKVQLESANDLIKNAGGGVKIQWNTLFGTPSSIVKTQGYLTEASNLKAEDVARNWIKENASLFGMTMEEVDALTVIRQYKMPGTELQPITFQQTFNGVESVYGGRLIVAVNKEGRILSVTGDVSRTKSFTSDFKLSSTDALKKVVELEAPTLTFTPKLSNQEKGWDVFDGGNVLPTKQRVKKAAFITGDEVRPAYRVLFIEKLDEGYEVIIDAVTGEKLFKRSLVNHALLEPEGLVFENYPGSKEGGYQIVKSFKGDPIASPNGWLLPTTGVGVTTLGNNADTYANWSNFLAPVDQVVRPVNPLGKFKFPFKNEWQKTKGAIVPPSYAEDVHSATTNLFYHHNLFHDYFYKLGWVEGAGNLQAVNFGKGGMDGDPILGLVQAGAVSGGAPTYTGRDNAYMLTLPDGIPAWSGMFLWEPIPGAFDGEYADGDYDAGIIYHEYSHALSNRFVAGGESLGSHQAGSMGEAWGDWFGMHYLVKEGLQQKPVVGAYVTGNNERGIRGWSLDENPLNFGDIGYDIVGPEVHSDGEIWAAILWHVREALIAQYGKETGERVSEQIIMDAMPISAPNPSMVDMRTAIVTADFERYGGEHFNTLWKAFAERGLGESAFSNGGNDTDPIPAFNHPDVDQNGILIGKVINAATNKPIENARIIIGQYEARTSAAVLSSEGGKFGLPMVNGTYDITIQAKGFGSTTIKGVTINAGKKNKLKFTLEPNMASSFNGASVVNVSGESDTNPVKFAIDDTEASVFASETQKGGFTGAEFVVKLAGDKPVKVSHIQVSAFKDVSKARFATLKDFTIQTSIDGENWTTVKEDSFITPKPRPAAPDLHYKGFDLETPVEASYVKLIAKSAQDNSKGYIQVAELQVFGGGKTKVEPLELEPEEPFVAKGTVNVGNAGTGIGSLAGVGATLAITENEFVTTQNSSPQTQGLDGYVVSLPAQYGDGIHNFTVAGESAAVYDFDIFFYNKNFELIGAVATAGADEAGVIPGGTRYVYVGLYSGANVPFTFTATNPY